MRKRVSEFPPLLGPKVQRDYRHIQKIHEHRNTTHTVVSHVVYRINLKVTKELSSAMIPQGEFLCNFLKINLIKAMLVAMQENNMVETFLRHCCSQVIFNSTKSRECPFCSCRRHRHS